MTDNYGMSQITETWTAGEQQNFMSRVGGWFRRNQTPASEQPFNGEDGAPPVLVELPEPPTATEAEPLEPQATIPGGTDGFEPRNTFLRPWAKRDQAIDNLSRGIGALSDLLVTIKDNMERQSQRQEDLLGHLATLPDVLRSIPESNRLHGQSLQAINQHIERQTAQQSKLGDILERISHADSQQGRTLDALQQTVSSLGDHDQAISENLQSLGMSLESMSTNSQSSALVLESLRDNSARRDGDLERVIKRQNARFTTLLSIAIILSIAALSAVSVFGYLAYDALTTVK